MNIKYITIMLPYIKFMICDKYYIYIAYMNYLNLTKIYFIGIFHYVF